MKNKKLYLKKKKYGKGFALIETIVAIAVLVGGIAGPMTIAARSIAAAQHAKNHIIASFLAEEGIEYIRNTRDTNSIIGALWLDGLSECMSGVCKVDSPLGEISSCFGGVCQKMRFDKTSGRYGYDSGWTESGFTRSISITDISANKEAKISVTISWPQNKITRNLTVEERIFNWQR